MGLRASLTEKTQFEFEAAARDWHPGHSRSAARHVAQSLVNTGQKPPPPQQLEQIRLEFQSAWAATRSLSGISSRALRRAPFFLFQPSPGNGPPLAADGDFRIAYLGWLAEHGRPSTIAVLTKAFLFEYPVARPWFETWRVSLSNLLESATGPAVERWRVRADKFRLLGKDAPSGFWDRVLAGEMLPDEFLAAAGLDGELARSTFLELACQSALQTHVRLNTIERLLSFLLEAPNRLRFESLRPGFASALLLPFRGVEPPTSELKLRIQNVLLAVLGDPRISVAAWHGVADAERTTMLRWLTAISFDTFMQILDMTADEHWTSRREFWSGYLSADGRQGALVEAWPVFGPAAQELARVRLKMDEKLFGRFPGRSGKNQSILIMKLRGPSGVVTVCEWSHAGAIRLWAGAGDTDPPELYARDYTVAALMVPPDYWAPHDQHDAWKKKIRDWILKETGARPR